MSSGHNVPPPTRPASGNLRAVLQFFQDMTGKGATAAQKCLVLILPLIVLCGLVVIVLAQLKVNLWVAPVVVAVLAFLGLGVRRAKRMTAGRVGEPPPDDSV